MRLSLFFFSETTLSVMHVMYAGERFVCEYGYAICICICLLLLLLLPIDLFYSYLIYIHLTVFIQTAPIVKLCLLRGPFNVFRGCI